MDPLTIGMITGGANLLGSIFSSNTSASNTEANIAMQQQTNQMNIAEAQKNRDFQEQMSNTAYQRASSDMQKAGLNPSMMFGSGGPASSPGGSVATAQAPRSDKTSPLAGLGEAARTAVSSAVAAKSMDKMSDEIANLRTLNEVLQKERDLKSAEKPLTEARTHLTDTEQNLAANRLPESRFSARRYESLEGLPKSVIDWMERGAYVGGSTARLMQPFTDFVSSARGVRDMLPRRSTTQESGVDSSGKSYDRFSDRWDNLWR